MKINITTKLVNQLKDYCLILATQYSANKKKTNQADRYIAEEAHSKVLETFHKRNLLDKWEEKQMNDNYYFLLCKNTILNTITREASLKTKVFKEFNNISLNNTLTDSSLIYELESNIEEYDRTQDDIETDKLRFIVNTLANYHRINEFDIEIFHYCLIRKNTIKKASVYFEKSEKTISNSRLKVINTIKYMWDVKIKCF
jgi:hypothetical protein